MKHYLNINNNSIDTDLDYNLDDDNLIINITKDCSIAIKVTSYDKKIKIVINDNLKVDLTSIIEREADNSFVNIEYNLGRDSFVNEFVLIEEDNFSLDYNKHAVLKENATYEVSNGFFNDSNINMKVIVDLDGRAAKALHNIAAISRFDNIKDFNITINNNDLETYGELNNFGVVKDTATLNFEGTGYIKKGAKQSEAHQESKIITFDPKVKAQANPFLIIDEADVAASHAAAVGQMDEEQLYYIQSRGIDFDNASRLITYGYLKPVLNKISDDSLKEKLEELIEEKAV